MSTTEQKPAAAKAPAKPDQPETEYVVLELRTMIALPEENTWTELMDAKGANPNIVFTGWLPIGKATVSGHKDRAVDEVTKGREGTFKAVSARAWKGGKTNKVVTKTESIAFED